MYVLLHAVLLLTTRRSCLPSWSLAPRSYSRSPKARSKILWWASVYPTHQHHHHHPQQGNDKHTIVTVMSNYVSRYRRWILTRSWNGLRPGRTTPVPPPSGRSYSRSLRSVSWFSRVTFLWLSLCVDKGCTFKTKKGVLWLFIATNRSAIHFANLAIRPHCFVSYG